MSVIKRLSLACVYEICHTPSGRKYVGATTGLSGRIAQHFGTLKNGIHHNKSMQHEWDTSTPGDWTFRVVEADVPDDNKRGREAWWIHELNPYYNSQHVTPMTSRLEKIERVLDLRSRGATMRQIAQLTHMSQGWVHHVVHHYQCV